MATYNTGNPVGSSDPRDLFDNAEVLDHWINDLTVDHWNDRLGVERRTLRGIENRFDGAMLDWDQRFSQALANVGYIQMGPYDDGPITITEYNQVVLKDGSWWKPSANLSLPYTTVEDWDIDASNFVSIGDGTLRDELAATGGVGLVGDALDKRNNLDDLPDKDAARTSLGIVRANQTQSEAGDSDTLFATPLGVSNRINILRPSQEAAIAGTSNDHIMTPLRTKQAIDSALTGHFAFRTDTRTSNETVVPCTYTEGTLGSMIITHGGAAPPARAGHMVVIRNVSASSGAPPQAGIYYVAAVFGSTAIIVGTFGVSGSGTLEMVFLNMTGSSNDFGVDSVVRVSAGIIVVNPSSMIIGDAVRYNHGHVSGAARSASSVLSLSSQIGASTLTPATATGGNYIRFISIQSGNGTLADAVDTTVIGFKA